MSKNHEKKSKPFDGLVSFFQKCNASVKNIEKRLENRTQEKSSQLLVHGVGQRVKKVKKKAAHISKIITSCPDVQPYIDTRMKFAEILGKEMQSLVEAASRDYSYAPKREVNTRKRSLPPMKPPPPKKRFLAQHSSRKSTPKSTKKDTPKSTRKVTPSMRRKSLKKKETRAEQLHPKKSLTFTPLALDTPAKAEQLLNKSFTDVGTPVSPSEILQTPKPLIIIPPPVNGNHSSHKNGRVLLSKKFQPLIKVKQKPPSPKARTISLASPIPSLEKEPKLSKQPIRFLTEEEFRHLPVYISQYFEDCNEINEHVSNLNKMVQKKGLEYLNPEHFEGLHHVAEPRSLWLSLTKTKRLERSFHSPGKNRFKIILQIKEA